MNITTQLNVKDVCYHVNNGVIVKGKITDIEVSVKVKANGEIVTQILYKVDANYRVNEENIAHTQEELFEKIKYKEKTKEISNA